IAAITEQYIGDPELSNLPRKFKSSISGCSAQCTHHEINDVAFAAVRHPETGEVGYDLWVGGGLSTNPMLAKRLGAFVRPGQVPEVWAAVCGVFRDYGYRRLRHRARIKFLIGDWGAPRFREVLEKEYLGYTLPDGPAPVGAGVGRVNGELLAAIGTLAERYGSGRVRTTAEQKMVIVDVPESSVAGLQAEL